MSGHVVLDTDVIVDVLRGRREVIARLADYSSADVGVASMTVAELLNGAVASSDPAHNEREVTRFLGEVRVLPFSARSAALHAELRWAMRGQPFGPNDLVIAATALMGGATLITGNTREFGRVPGLLVESWRA